MVRKPTAAVALDIGGERPRIGAAVDDVLNGDIVVAVCVSHLD
jgi:hypothetical protein